MAGETGRVERWFVTRVDAEDEFSLEWIGINKSCSVIPRDALSLIDNHRYHEDDSPRDDFGRFRKIEWAYEPDWFCPEFHWCRWIPLEQENDNCEGTWTMKLTLLLPLAGPSHQGLWHLTVASCTIVRNSVTFWWVLLEDICGSPLYDEETHIPFIFNVERIDLEYGGDFDAHKMVMDAKRAILDCWGWIGWWIAAMPGWMEGLSNDIVQRVLDLVLPADNK
jgi:hypothetical protein